MRKEKIFCDIHEFFAVFFIFFEEFFIFFQFLLLVKDGGEIRWVLYRRNQKVFKANDWDWPRIERGLNKINSQRR